MNNPERRHFVVLLLVLCYACAFINRQIINLVAPGIQDDFSLTDFEMGILLGPAFAILFVVSGVVFGRLADRINRIRMIQAGVAGWSVLAAICGLAPTFVVLILARMGVGVAQGMIAPAGVSLISDLYPPARRARPLAYFNMGSNVGSASSYLIGATIIPAVPVLIPVLGMLEPWQAGLIYIGAPGLLLALAAMTVREPVRGERATSAAGRDSDFLRKRAWLFATLIAGATMQVAMGYGSSAWLPTLFVRKFGWGTAQIGFSVGITMLVVTLVSTTLAGLLATRLRARGHSDAALKAMFVGSCLMLLPAVAAWQMDDPWLALVLYGCQFFGMTFASNLVGAALCDVAPNEWRASLFALYLFVSTIAGLGMGPPVIGALAQNVFDGDLGNAISFYGAVVAPLAIVFYLLCFKAFRKGAAEAAAWSAPKTQG